MLKIYVFKFNNWKIFYLQEMVFVIFQKYRPILNMIFTNIYVLDNST